MKKNTRKNTAQNTIVRHCTSSMKRAQCDGNYACSSCSIAKLYQEIQKESDK